MTACGGAPVTETERASVRHLPRYELHYSAPLDADADRLQPLIDHAIETLTAYFSDLGGPDLLEGVDLSVHLLPRATSTVATGRSLSETRGTEVALSFLSPSRYEPGALNAAGEPFDDEAWRTQILHELVTTFASRATLLKRGGWNYFLAPNWFMQGYEEYVSHRLGGERSRTTSMDRHRARFLARGGTTRFQDGEIVVDDPYLDGLFLVLFLHERFGEDAGRRLLASDRSTFWEAMQQTFDLDPATLGDAFARWTGELARARQTAKQKLKSSGV